jgi:hypothetical protein
MAEFARRWVAAWNRRDIEAVVAHFSEDARFTSPRAAERTGRATVVGRPALAAYWQGARALPSLHFTLDRVLWDAEKREGAILYLADLGGKRLRAVEIMRFGADGLIAEGEALYGAAA